MYVNGELKGAQLEVFENSSSYPSAGKKGRLIYDYDLSMVLVDTGSAFETVLTGAIAGNDQTATEATNVTVSAKNTTNATFYPVFVDGATGAQGIDSDTGLTYNPSTGILTTTKVVGDLQGAVVGNADTATTATKADTIPVADLADANATFYPVFVSDVGGLYRAPSGDSDLTYNPSTNLMQTNVLGDVTGDVAGNLSGATVTLNGSSSGTVVVSTDSTATKLAVNKPVDITGTLGVSGDLSLGAGSDLVVLNNGVIKMWENTPSYNAYVQLQAPVTITSSYTLQLPSATGAAGEILKTNGSGVLSWIAHEDPSTGFSAIAANLLPDADNTRDIGSGDFSWKNLHIEGTATLASAAIDSLDVSFISSDFKPVSTNSKSLGGNTNQWKDLYIDGTAYIDTLDSGCAYSGTGLSSYTTTASSVTKYQIKQTSAQEGIPYTTHNDITTLSFETLEAGTYRMTVHFELGTRHYVNPTTMELIYCDCSLVKTESDNSGDTDIVKLRHRRETPDTLTDTDRLDAIYTLSGIFTMAGDFIDGKIRFRLQSNMDDAHIYFEGGSAILERLPNHSVTTDW